MKKRIIFLVFIIFTLLSFQADLVIAAWPELNCQWLPGCESWDSWTSGLIGFMTWTIKTFIQYIAIIAVISVMISWIMYLVSWGEEEKINRSKKWIIWSLVWVILSISAWGIINFINQLSINN